MQAGGFQRSTKSVPADSAGVPAPPLNKQFGNFGQISYPKITVLANGMYAFRHLDSRTYQGIQFLGRTATCRTCLSLSTCPGTEN